MLKANGLCLVDVHSKSRLMRSLIRLLIVDRCIETRQFCSRGTPCRRCTNKEIFCSRPSGEQISRSKKQRSGQVSPPKKRVRIDPVAAVQDTPVKDEPGIHAEDEIVAGSSSSASVPVVLAPKRRTLPRSVVKSSVPKVKVEKSEKSVKPAALSPDQQNSVKPPCIGQPPVWAEVRLAPFLSCSTNKC